MRRSSRILRRNEEITLDDDWRQRIADKRARKGGQMLWILRGPSIAVIDEDAEDLVFGKE